MAKARDWKKCPASNPGHALLARPLPRGTIVTLTERHSERRDANAPQWDMSVAELEWLLAMAKGEAPNG